MSAATSRTILCEVPPLDPEETEGEAAEIYRRAYVDPARPPGMLRLAARVPGLAGIEMVPELFHSAELVQNEDGRSVIRVREGLSTPALTWNVAHELAEHALQQRRFPYYGVDRERVANGIAAAVLVPRPALRAAVAVHGFALDELAALFSTSQTIVALRIGEALERPVALVSSRRILRAGGPALLPRDRVLFQAVILGRWDGLRVRQVTDVARTWFITTDE